MAYYSGGGGTGGNNPPPRRPPPYPLRDTWMKSPPDYNSAPSSVQHGQPYHPHQRTPCDPDTEIYENIYDSRWRLLNQEAARLQREQTWTPSSALSPTPPPVAGSSSSRESSLDPSTIHTASASVLSTRSPRQIIIQRSEDGFGFTLRHFIVYPPEEPTPEQIRVDIKEPLDTIFVKSVRESGPAHLAGLQCGDRIISVNGESVSGKSYAEVVGLIQRLRDNLSLIVVPKQDDILQMYFSDIAQNPETNPRPVTATPSREFHSSGYLPALPRETSPFSEFVTNGPTRIMMPGHQQPQNYRVPEPIPPPWMGQHPPGLPSNASSASVATSTSTTEHAYAMPARVVRTSESLERVDPRSVGSLVSLNDNSWNQRTASVASSRTLGSEAAAALATTTTGESVPSNDSDPVISRIKRDFERKQEFLRTTNLPNYLASPVSEEQQAQGPQQHPVKGGGITQEEQRQQATAPVYFGDRFPIHHPRLDEEDGAGGPLRGSNEAQFHLYGLPLGYRRSGRQFEEDETYHIQQQQQQQQQPQFGTTQALSHLHHHHHHQAHQHLNTPNRSSPNHPTPHSYHHPRQSYLNAHYDGSIIPGGGGGAGGAGAPTRSNGPVVLRRKKKQQQQQQHLDDEEERNLRRVSYLRATKEDRMHIDSDAEDPEHLILPSTPKHSTTSEHGADGVGTPRHAPSIQRIRALFGEKGDESQSPQTGCPPESLREGWLHCKVTAVEGKKSVDRSWRNVYAVLTSDSLSVYKDKKIDKNNQLSFEEVPPIILSESGVEVADDYTKRKYVFRLKTQSASEVLFQAESEANLSHWIDKLEPLAEASVNASSQAPASTPASANPLASSGGRKLTSTRNRSPTGHSPATKNRKPSADQGPMTKENSHKKTWKGKVAKQWKRMQGSTSTTGNSAYPEGGSIGVPLEDCPMCPDLECVPMIVRTCCTMVEDNGLDIVGIYRVPGNSAAVTALTEQVNSRGEEVFLKLDDPKWHDVNVVTSLLKSFFRKLPDPIFTTDMYNVFIEMSKIEECNRRLNALRKLIRELPEVHFETLHHLCQHLVRVIDHSEINKMEVRNLAIVFGPTLVRPADDNMMSMVTDMSQQCRIIESILSHFEWFFSDDEEELDEEDEVSEAHMDLVKLNEPGHENNHSVLLSNLQKLEEAGKMSSSSSNNKEVSAKDIMSGIISAANRKMLRSQNKSSTSSSKKDSVGNETSKSTPKLDHLDKSASSNATSRRNSESVFHGAVAIAAAVPQLMVNAGNSMSTSNLPTAGIVTSSSSSTQVQAASQENLINSVESTVMSSSTSRIVSTAFYDESGFKEDSTGKKIKFPIETYQGLEKATAERVRRFVDETKANLMRGRLESSPNLNNARTTSDAHVETWTDDLAGGILFQDDPYPVNAYNERVQAQDRFLNLTYRSPSVIKTPEHHHRMMRASHSGGGNQNQAYFPHRAGLTRGLSLGELNPPRELLTPHEFDTKKVASHGTLKRLKLVKSPTDTQLFVPNHHGHHHHQLHHPLVPLIHDPAASDSMLTSLTHDFDEKMKLLLDPNYSSQSDTSSVQSTPSKYAKLRRVSDHQNQSGSTNYSKTSRSISLGEDSQNLNEKQLSILNEQQQRTNKKSELKRGRVVDKNHPRPQRPTSGAEDVDEGKENKKVRSRNRRLRRRHTVGGTKDFVDVEAATEAAIEDQPRMSSQEGLLDLQPSNYHYTVMMNVDRSLGQWIRRQQKIGKSSPDLSIIGRRLSLPDTVLANSAAFYPSLLESQV